MKTIKFDDGTNTNSIGYFYIKDIGRKNIMLGNSVRNIDGELITYNRGNKIEYTINLEPICKENYEWLQNYSINQTKLISTITNDITNEVETLNSIIEISDPKYDNLKDLYTITIKVRQYD